MAPRRRRRRTEPPRCALPPHPVCPGPASPVSTSPQGGSQAPRRRYPLPPFRAMIAVVPSAVPVTPAAVAALASPRDAHPGLDAASAGLAVLGLAALMGGAAALVHRRRARRLFAARITARLDAITGPGSGPRSAAADLQT